MSEEKEVTAEEAVQAAKNIGLLMVLIIVVVVLGLFALASIVRSVS